MTTSQNTTWPTTSNSTSIDDFWIEYGREDFYGDVNDKLLEALAASGLSKADLARKLNSDPATVTRWLAGPRNITLRSVADLATALGLIPKLILEKAENTSQAIGRVDTKHGDRRVTFHVTAVSEPLESGDELDMEPTDALAEYDRKATDWVALTTNDVLYTSGNKDNDPVLSGA